MFSITSFPEELLKRANAPLLSGILRGIERETLRVDADGKLSQHGHPQALGSALAHPQITTDFSEALLEFITPPTHRLGHLFKHLENIHQFTAEHIGDELLWANSMPCVLPENEDDIPVGQYGSSNNGLMKTVYRRGLGLRYGRSMQTVAGLHYNFSLPNSFWAHFHAKENSLLSLEAYRTKRYFDLIRNFRRHSWLLVLLFGASPAMCPSFVNGRKHDLDTFAGGKALFRPYATSLRMGDLGYQSNAQKQLFVCYNHKDTYIKTLTNAILQPYQGYQDIPLKDADSEYQQLSQGLLQIENEFYSSIRPKRTAKPGETALTALHRRGVEYIEVRCLDVNPFSSVGITKEQVCLLDTFLVYCALADSPLCDVRETEILSRNQSKIVNEGRKPGLTLEHQEYGELKLTEWAAHLFESMKPVAQLLDAAYHEDRYVKALESQRHLVENMESTPSARLLTLLESSDSFIKLSLDQARENMGSLKAKPLAGSELKRYQDISEESHAQQRAIEENSTAGFDDFLKDYYKQYEVLSSR